MNQDAGAVLYTRPACPLCFAMKREASRLARRFRLPLRTVDISGTRDLLSRYGTEVPVLELPGGVTFRGRAESAALYAAFREASKGTPRPERLS
ncbi:MAG: glutaredoxin family protein [Acidobacteria bacterium]|nr:glutaredoxin family protein [Acidobacteriota bacterium]